MDHIGPPEQLRQETKRELYNGDEVLDDDAGSTSDLRQTVALDTNAIHGLRARLVDASRSQHDDVVSVGDQLLSLASHAHVLRIRVVLQRHHDSQRPSTSGSVLIEA